MCAGDNFLLLVCNFAQKKIFFNNKNTGDLIDLTH